MRQIFSGITSLRYSGIWTPNKVTLSPPSSTHPHRHTKDVRIRKKMRVWFYLVTHDPDSISCLVLTYQLWKSLRHIRSLYGFWRSALFDSPLNNLSCTPPTYPSPTPPPPPLNQYQTFPSLCQMVLGNHLV